MNPLKKLAGQTVIYGLSSVVGRLLNYLLVPLYTRYFLPEEYGIVTELYAYVAFLVVMLTYGIETAFFRYSQKVPNKKTVYSTALISLLITSSVFIFIIFFSAQPISNWLQYPNNTDYVKFLQYNWFIVSHFIQKLREKNTQDLLDKIVKYLYKHRFKLVLYYLLSIRTRKSATSQVL